jgi:hypothetical protein
MPGGQVVTYNGFAMIAAFVGLAHVLLAGAILWATAAAFDRIVGRAGDASRRGGARPAPRAAPAPAA